jgi:CMP-N,N'-diacetyllegionaminic acid synthase
MYADKSILAVIAARGGSKGLPRKNVLQLGGKPLIAWSIEAARGSIYIDRAIVSSDDQEIIAIARNWKGEVPFIRPAELAHDSSSIYDALLHALDSVEQAYDYVVLLQATSPLRRPNDIDACIEACMAYGAPAGVTVTPAAKSPYHYFTLASDGRMQAIVTPERSLVNRQDLPETYVVNGAVYVARTDWMRAQRTFYGPDTIGHVMPSERSVDIDSALDLALAEALLAQQPSHRATDWETANA